MTKNTEYTTQGQGFSTEKRGKVASKIVENSRSTDQPATSVTKSDNFEQNSQNFGEKTGDLRHRVEDFSINHDISEAGASKNREKIDSEPSFSLVGTKNAEKSSKNDDFTINSEIFGPKLSDPKDSYENSIKSSESPATIDNNAQNGENDDLSYDNASKRLENADENRQKSLIASSFESQIERDYKNFSRFYPNVSKDTLLGDQSLRSFALGKENQPLSQVYKDFCSLITAIELKVLKESAHRLSVEKSSVGALSSAKSADDGYFSREQVQRMSPEEVRRNYKRIRESQERW